MESRSSNVTNGYITIDFSNRTVPFRHKLLGAVYGNNGCCPGKPYLICQSNLSSFPVYSCECYCGMWCTSGHFKIELAVNEYEDMTRKVKEREDAI